MAHFRDLPIKRKLALIVIATTSVALLAACSALIASEFLSYRRSLVEKTTVLADVIGANSTATLSFRSEDDARQNLAPLKADPDIMAGCLYTVDGKLLASYARFAAVAKLPQQPSKDGIHFGGGNLVLFRPVLLKDQSRVGTIYLEATLDGMYARLRSFAGISVFVLAASLFLAVALSSGLQRFISRPILALSELARRVAENRDYAIRAPKESDDELGLLTESFNQMLADIAERNSALESANAALQAHTRQIVETVTVLGSSAQEILDFTKHVAANATETATAVTQTTTTVEEVRQIAHVASQKAREVSEDADRVTKSSEMGKSSTVATIEGMTRIREQMESIAECMLRLSEQSKAISEIVTAVDDLAAQSNLLAVNASIEAAKAGDHGRGFAVVAQEVKSLASRSKQATNQVRAILKDIQQATAGAVMASEQGSKAVDAGVKQSTEAGASIVTLTESVTLAAQAASQIAASSQQQLAGMDQVAAAMENVKAMSVHSVENAKELEIAAGKLSELGEKFRQLLAQRPPSVPSVGKRK